MRRLLFHGFLSFLVILVVIIGLSSKQSSASPGSFGKVIPFSTGAGLTAFFDQSDGKLYLYDGEIKNCIFIAQMGELGKPTKRLK